ncbi:MAG TPA: hypothetical protein VKD47_01520 [Miltoncostaeaceae bacterium]|nr:hypothetical protein [Miltoncostaeaceae bacterium]
MALCAVLAASLVAGCGSSGGTTTAAPVAMASRLPPAGLVAGTTVRSTRELPTAIDLAGAVRRAGDPGTASAVQRLEAAGYAGGAIREWRGTDPSEGLTLMRGWVARLRDGGAARRELQATVAEARNGQPASDVAIPGAPDGRGILIDPGPGRAATLLLAAPRGSDLVALQAVAPSAAALPADAIARAFGRFVAGR